MKNFLLKYRIRFSVTQLSVSPTMSSKYGENENTQNLHVKMYAYSSRKCQEHNKKLITFDTQKHYICEHYSLLTALKSTFIIHEFNVWQNRECSVRYIYTGCPRRNVKYFGRVFLELNYTDITQNTYIQSWAVTEITAREVWNFDICYTLTDYQIHIETGWNMWFR